MSTLIIDQETRQEALNPSHSFIVQAPAGSGKTELLTQRFLKLLSFTEKNPEEIIAITFTRKAAAEMRQRIIFALQNTKRGKPEASHKQVTWELAKKVLERDKRCNWQLQKNPNRLRILTIDALSAYLVKQMPLSAQLSPQITITDNPSPYYQEAAENTLLAHPMEPLLLHLDNRISLLKRLFVDILSKREQWLPHITGQKKSIIALRKHMENALKNVVQECLQTITSHLTDEIRSQLIPLANFAGRYCIENDIKNPIVNCYDIIELSASLNEFSIWLGIANLLLKKNGEWRKSITKKQGFPPKCELKTQMIDFLQSLSKNDTLRAYLHAVMQCPPMTYDEQQWKIINLLIDILPLLAAELNVIFSRECVTDFIELNFAALRALGDEENPTDLALHLDYRINHLLIDEFQDTSIIQFRLIEKLIAGWTPKDGRSIFLVGDPMQSIYRFRNAEVGLFLRAQQQGIGNIPLERLTLKQNFRSNQSIVEWSNQNFQMIFPSEPNIALGAIPYSTVRTGSDAVGYVQWHPSINDDKDDNNEAKLIVQQIQTLQNKSPGNSIAILVRSRTQLTSIIEQLHQAMITFQAINLEPLVNLIEVQDIHSLTRALLHRADRIAWLAVLRAPYCGLRLTDLNIISNIAHNKSIWSSIKEYELLPSLSEDARLRLQYIVPPLYNAIEHIGRYPFSHLLRNLWHQLNVTDTLRGTKQIINIDYYLKLIESLETKNKPLSLIEINAQLEKLFAEPHHDTNTTLKIMTIHKAKGLEFDHVLLPGLHHRASSDKNQILKWLERPNLSGNSDLLLAPIKAIEQDGDSIYNYLNRIDKIKTDYEYARLLYVAATRAKQSLHLFANITLENNQIKLPSHGTFLNLLWENAKPYFKISEIEKSQIEEKTKPHDFYRFTKDYLETREIPIIKTITRSQPINIALKNSTPQFIGTIIHETLEHIALTGCDNSEKWPQRLKQFGVPETKLLHSIEIIQQAVQRTQQDSRGQWILSNKHKDARCEFPISFFDGKQTKQLIIDRCFIENGIRWIIDYKTGTPSPEEYTQYKQQLKQYANAFMQLEKLPIRLGLYFPLNSEWMEWVYTMDTDTVF